MTTEYSVIYFDYGVYHKNKVKIKKIMSNHGLKWNNRKINDLNINETIEIYTLFGHKDKLEKDTNLQGRISTTGIWESGSEAVKAVMLEKKSENEHLPALLIVKGLEKTEFHQEFTRFCTDLGGDLSKVVQTDEGSFNKVSDKKVDNYIGNYERFTSFSTQIRALPDDYQIIVGDSLSISKMRDEFNEFKKRWRELQIKYRDYTREDFYKEIEQNNKKKNLIKQDETKNVETEKVKNEPVINTGKETDKTKIRYVIKRKKVIT